ncbi:hypothetical protein FIV06_23990 [Labrenzia sp. THAF191b]|uniref:hypothetical protein n=1 Tax=unclassified Labrenzia TaxID=2648686 RepID=UPI0012693C34|nr:MULTISPECIES: hypothetical protein [unclassified Labrenzia]QFT00511.1 hypothetical protein FIV06_23990 [Labrenzia sp. THAF191b]QFT06824.1 hypothetical protein FIV05_23985 [Labrenzia sp. THAF191a]QFT18368.1 hypothetical protein FIV03_24000 [Labrenzia sp. THAF187b]
MARSSAETLFDVAAKTPEGQRPGMYATITCACGKTEDVFAGAGVSGKSLPAEPLRKKFQRAGWHVGPRKGKHSCPACQKAAAWKPDLVKADPPRRPTPEQSRALLEALEIVFCPEAGFDAGYDDARVATEQNMPRRWVEDIREQFLGPVPAPKVDHIAEARKGLESLSRTLAEFTGALEAASLARRVAAEQLVEISKHLEEVGQ